MRDQKTAFSVLIGSICVLVLFSCAGGEKEEKSERTLPPVRREPEYTYPGNRQIPYKSGETYNYIYFRDGEEIGTASFIIDEYSGGGISIYSLIDYHNEESGDKLSGFSLLILDEDYQIEEYNREIDSKYGVDSSLNGIYGVKIERLETEMVVEKSEPGLEENFVLNVRLASGDDSDKYALKLEEVFLFDNNSMGMMALICSQPELKSGRRSLIKVLTVTYESLMTLAMTAEIRKEIEHHGKKTVVYEVDMKTDEATFGKYYITSDGVIIKAEEEGGFLEIILQNPLW